MRELEVLGDGHLKLDFADWKEFFETEMTELVRGQLKRLIEQALLAERGLHLDLGYYEHDPPLPPRLPQRVLLPRLRHASRPAHPSAHALNAQTVAPTHPPPLQPRAG